MASGSRGGGWDGVRGRLDRIAKETPKIVATALYQEALVEQKEAMTRCPVDTGALRGSHQTQRPVIAGGDISVAIVCGGPAAPYAVHVHENLEADHPVGEAKWLERTIRESAPFMAERIGKRVRALLEKAAR